jgi:hypothetical protein
MKTSIGKKRSRDEATGSAQVSTLPTSPSRLNPNKEWKDQGEDQRPAGAGQQRFPPGKGNGHVVRHRGRSITNGEEPRRDPNVHAVRVARAGSPGE